VIFKQRSEFTGKHAFLSPSQYHWLNYDEQKLEARYHSFSSARRGTDLHALAHEAIRLGILLDPSNEALAAYVNDAIELGMTCEQLLYFSDNCFGTADTISFYNGLLRIHDLKTGVTPVKEKQLEVYAALFCLEYGEDPFEIEIELRIYQREEVRTYIPIPEGILFIMDKIIQSDRQLETIKGG
jgi:hypothetical protein